MSIEDQKPPDSGEMPSSPPDQPTGPAPEASPNGGAGPSAAEGMDKTAPSQAPSEPDRPFSSQDTVVSPKLRQLAQTPSQPLRKPPVIGERIGDSPSRVYMLAGLVAILVLLAVILVGVVLAQKGPGLLAGLGPTKTPTATATRRATSTPLSTPTSAATPTAQPSPTINPPTARPAPTALAPNVLAKVTPPEGLKLKVRDKASPGTNVLGELDANTQVTIVDGPTDASGIRWWKVDNGKGLVGWSAEGLAGVTYLTPVGWAK